MAHNLSTKPGAATDPPTSIRLERADEEVVVFKGDGEDDGAEGA